MATASKALVLESIKSLRESALYSDLTITCSGDAHKVHKAIVCPRAIFFARSLKFGGVESQSDTINLPEDEPGIIRLLIQFLYEGDYDHLLLCEHVTAAEASRWDIVFRAGYWGLPDIPHSCWSVCDKQACKHHTCSNDNQSPCCNNFVCVECHMPIKGGPDQMMIHVKMYEIADKYDVVGLKELAKSKLQTACEVYWQLPELVAVATHVFSTTPDHDKGLTGVIANTILEHMGDLIGNDNIEELLTEFNGAAYEILKLRVAADKVTKAREDRCGFGPYFDV